MVSFILSSLCKIGSDFEMKNWPSVQCGQKIMYTFAVWPSTVKVQIIFWPHFCKLCYKLSSSLSLCSLFVWERADTKITLPHHPPTHRKLFKHLEVTYSQVWYIIRIVSLSPTHFHSDKIGLIRVTYDPLSVLGLINI